MERASDHPVVVILTESLRAENREFYDIFGGTCVCVRVCLAESISRDSLGGNANPRLASRPLLFIFHVNVILACGTHRDFD